LALIRLINSQQLFQLKILSTDLQQFQASGLRLQLYFEKYFINNLHIFKLTSLQSATKIKAKSTIYEKGMYPPPPFCLFVSVPFSELRDILVASLDTQVQMP
jgi:hypothetical protein